MSFAVLVRAPRTLHLVALQRAGPVNLGRLSRRVAPTPDTVKDCALTRRSRVGVQKASSWSGLAHQCAERRRLAPFRDVAGGGAPGNGLPPLDALGLYDHQIVFPSQPDAGSHRGADPRTFGARF